MIRQVKDNPENKRWCVFSEDGSKNLGCGPSEDWAKKRLGQVEYFKKAGQHSAIDGMEDGLDLAYEPPAAPDDAPAELKKILAEVYSSCREQDPGEDPDKKSRCAAIAWSAVKAKFKKNDKGKWIRKNELSLAYCLDIETAAFSKSGDGVYSKSILCTGTWTHPLTGKKVVVTEDKITSLHQALLKFGKANIDIPFPKRHTIDPTENLGWWDPKTAKVEEIDGKKHIVMSVRVTDTATASKIDDGSLKDVSVYWVNDHTIQTGEKLADAILHVCATSYPVLNNQPSFKAVIPDGLSGEREISFLVYKQETEDNMELLDAARKAFGGLKDEELIKKLESFDLKALEEKAQKADEYEALDIEGLKKAKTELETLKKAETQKLVDKLHKLSAEVGNLMTEEEFKAFEGMSDKQLKLQLKSLEAVAKAQGIKDGTSNEENGKDFNYLDYAKNVLERQGFTVEVKGDKIVQKEK